MSPRTRAARAAILIPALLVPGVSTPEPVPGSPDPALGAGLQMAANRGAGLSVGTPAQTPDPTGVGREPRVDLFLVGDVDAGALRKLGVAIRTRAGAVTTASAPLAVVERLKEVPGLVRATLARPARSLLDRSVVEIRGDQVRGRAGDVWMGSTGRNVVVGIVDSGLDPTHEDFKRPDGGTRVLFYWDQADPEGPPPRTGSGDTLYDFGTEWTGTDIDAGGALPADRVGHGTHVAGIAAGGGRAALHDSTRYRFTGVAPEADLVVVAADLFLETGILDAVNYVFEKAQSVGRPAVVNLSLGTQFGPHDGTSPLELGIDALVGPGRLAVAAAGNEADNLVHAELHVPPGGSDSASVLVPATTDNPGLDFFVVEGFYREPDRLEVTVVTPGGRRLGPYPLGQATDAVLTGEGTLFLAHVDSDPTSSNLQIQFDVSDFNPDTLAQPTVPPPAPGRWTLVCSDLAGSPAGGEVDLWMPLSSILDFAGNPPRWTVDRYDPGEEIASPGTARGVVTVGSYNTKRCWPDSIGTLRCAEGVPETFTEPGKISYFSSLGPTRDGREKPDLVAPGFVISSAFSHQTDASNRNASGVDRTLDPDREHQVRAGTSMATAHVTGALALMLELDPDAAPAEAAARLRATARTDAFTGPVWNAAAGHGKLDVRGMVDSTLVPAWVRELILETSPSGLPRLRWQADPSDPVVSFRLESAGKRASWRLRGRFAGRGPHAWTDDDAVGGRRYRLLARVRTGETVLWAETRLVGAPGNLVVGKAQPNPFQVDTTIHFQCSLKVCDDPETRVVDSRGRLIRRLRPTSGPDRGGWVRWDGRDDHGRLVPAGIYWIQLRTGSLYQSRRLVRLR